MKHKKIMSFIMAAAMLSSAVPTMTSAEGGEVDGSEIIDKNMETEDVTFTEYNDKENKMYSVVGRNRLDARADSAIPYQDEQTALKSAVNYAKETSSRVKMLTGKGASNQWDMTMVFSVMYSLSPFRRFRSRIIKLRLILMRLMWMQISS